MPYVSLYKDIQIALKFNEAWEHNRTYQKALSFSFPDFSGLFEHLHTNMC